MLPYICTTKQVKMLLESKFKTLMNKINGAPEESVPPEVQIDRHSSVFVPLGSSGVSLIIDLDELLFLCFTSSAQYCGSASISNISAITFGTSCKSRNCSSGV